jgi:hypothetical protein
VPFILSKFLFSSTNATGQIDDEREKETAKKLNVAVDIVVKDGERK